MAHMHRDHEAFWSGQDQFFTARAGSGVLSVLAGVLESAALVAGGALC